MLVLWCAVSTAVSTAVDVLDISVLTSASFEVMAAPKLATCSLWLRPRALCRH